MSERRTVWLAERRTTPRRRSPRCSSPSATSSATTGRRTNAFLAGVEKLLDDPHTDYVLGAPHDDAPPAGVAQLRFRQGLWRAGGDCLVEDLYVAPSARRGGLARAIMDFSLARARERGCRRAELDVNERNAAALALYEGLGFSASANAYGGARPLHAPTSGRRQRRLSRGFQTPQSFRHATARRG